MKMRHFAVLAFLSTAMALAPVATLAQKDQPDALPPSLPLWPKEAPGSEGQSSPEKINDLGKKGVHDRRVTNIHSPSLTVFLPAKDKATGAAVIICPGGGHKFLTIDNEGYDVAKWLADHGVAGFVLKYRLANDTNSPYKVDIHALADAQRAIRTVRAKANEWGVSPKALGILGFSAGGQVAGLAGSRFDVGNPDDADPIERFSTKPDFQALIYGGGGGKTVQAKKDTPPTWILVAHDDNAAVGLANTYVELKKAGVQAELHIYSRGGHGFGIRERPMPVSSWPMRFHEWLGDLGFLGKR
jgi:acetyl esterase/lipase